jgi:flagellar hook-associated protein 2
MSTITSLGIGSGLDLSGLLDQLRDAERGRLEPLNQQKADQEAKLSAYGKLQGALSAFESAVDKLSDPSLYQSLSSSVTGTSVTSAATSDAVPGRYDVNVTDLARSQSLATDGFAEGHTFAAGPLSIERGSVESFDVNVEDGDTLEDVRDRINAAGSGVTASIVNDGSADPYRLVLTTNDTGTEAAITSVTYGSDARLTFAGMTEAVAAQDAALTVNGIAITSQSNRVEGAIQGVTLDLAETGEASVTVERDNLQVRQAVNAFVDSYNALQGTSDELTRFNAETGVAGELVGDSALRGIESRLRGALGSSVAEGAFSTLSEVGVSLQLDGTLELDDEQLDDAIVNNRQALTDFFAGQTEDGGLADRVGETLSQMLGDNGLLGTAMSGVENRISSIETRAERMEVSVERTIERYRQQFVQLDSMVAEMNQTSSYLTQQFDNLNAMLGRDD